ncbi:MAG: Lrp/AsnC family transcriptional regulator, partial [Clostridia bacterium]|nr:Lrp/AsnC family transcriptional regulator [Clostridia bacterium]
MTALEKDILEILTADARFAPKEIAAMLSVSEEQVKETIKEMEVRGLLVKYTAIVNSERTDEGTVEALIE